MGGSSKQSQRTSQTTTTTQLGVSDYGFGQLVTGQLAQSGGVVGGRGVTAGSGGLAVSGRGNVISMTTQDVSADVVGSALQGVTSIADVIARLSSLGILSSAQVAQQSALSGQAVAERSLQAAERGFETGAELGGRGLETGLRGLELGAEVAQSTLQAGARGLELGAEVAGAGLQAGTRGLEIGADVAGAGLQAGTRGLEIGAEVAGRALEAGSGLAETLGLAAQQTASGLGSAALSGARGMFETGAGLLLQLGQQAQQQSTRQTELALDFGERSLLAASGAIQRAGDVALTVAAGSGDLVRQALESTNVNVAAAMRLADASQQRMAALVESRSEQTTPGASESKIATYALMAAGLVAALALLKK